MNLAVLSFTFNPRSCTVSGTLQQATTVDGGTGLFTGATGSFAGTVSLQGRARHSPDGSCALDQELLHEVDTVAGSGSLSF